MGLDLTTLLIWTLRIVLPILFFAIYFRLQAPAKQEKTYAGPTTNVHARDTLLLLRKAIQGTEAPESMKNIVMKDQTEAPHLFAGTRAPRADRTRRPVDDPTRVPKERREKKEKKEEKEEPTAEAVALSEEKMHLESLLNYVAFNRQDHQRTHLGGPSSSPPEKAEVDAAVDAAMSVASGKITGATAEKANDEAQMVLRGAIGLMRPDVAQNLYDQLIEARVDISETTFELMIDVCLCSKDLKGASDLLLKMENAGYTPNSQMLDKVLDLYSKQEKDKSIVEQAGEDAPADASLDEVPNEVVPETAEKSTAEVPVEYIMSSPSMVPTFNWDAIESDSDDDGDETAGEPVKLRTDAPVFVPSYVPTKAATAEELAKSAMLSATAEPFNPQYNMTFDPVNYTWTSMDQPEGESWYSDKGKGKSKGKGKGKWKSKDDGWHAKGSKGDRDDGWHRDKAASEKVEKKEQPWEAKEWKPKAGNSWESKPEMRWRAKPSESAES